MRAAFREELDAVFDELEQMSRLVRTAVQSASQALLHADAAIAEAVISGDAEIDRLREQIEEQCFTLLSLQAPVARDLRIVVAALRMVTELERMGDLCAHVARIARMRVPEQAVPERMVPTMSEMAAVAEHMVEQLTEVIARRDVDAAAALARDDEQMDQLRKRSFAELLDHSWEPGVEVAVDLALLGRYYERIADHAVSVGNRVVFVVTGELLDQV